MKLIFKTEMLIYQSKANLDENFLFGKVTYQLDLETRKMLVDKMLVDMNDRQTLISAFFTDKPDLICILTGYCIFVYR